MHDTAFHAIFSALLYWNHPDYLQAFIFGCLPDMISFWPHAAIQFYTKIYDLYENPPDNWSFS